MGAILLDDVTHPAFEGCSAKFSILLIPRQILYPKFCEKHRSEYRRRNDLRK